MKLKLTLSALGIFILAGSAAHAEFVPMRFKPSQCSLANLKDAQGRDIPTFRAFEVCIGKRIGIPNTEFIAVDSRLYQVEMLRQLPQVRLMGTFRLRLIGDMDASGDLLNTVVVDDVRIASIVRDSSGALSFVRIFPPQANAGDLIEAKGFHYVVVTE